MTNIAHVPHILIEGRPDLTRRLWEICDRRPIVLTSRVVSSPVYQATRPLPDRSALEESAIYGFSGTALLPGMEQRYPEVTTEVRNGFRQAMAIARDRFGLVAGEPVELVVVGSQGSLWHNEHANVAMFGWLFPEAQGNDDDEIFALKCLGLSAQNRQYVACLNAELAAIDGLNVRWLTEAFPHLCGGEASTLKDYHEIAAKARAQLTDHPTLRRIGGAIPLLFTRRDGGQWIEFTERWPSRPKLAQRGQNPYRSTGQLIQQYLEYPDKQRLECVLVKVLSETEATQRLNPCDNPIITTSELAQARNAGISAILLDARYGAADLISEGREILEDMVAWQRSQIASAIGDTQPLVDALREVRRAKLDALGASTFLAQLVSEFDALGARIKTVGKRNPGTTLDVTRINPFARLYQTFVPFRRTTVSKGPRHDAEGNMLITPPRSVTMENLTDDELFQAISDTVAQVNATLDQGTLKPPINALAAFLLIEGISHDLVDLLSLCNELQGRIEEVHERAESSASNRGALARLWHRTTRQFHRFRRTIQGDAASARELLRVVEIHAGLLRTLEAAAEDLHGQLGAHLDRGDYPPIFRV